MTDTTPNWKRHRKEHPEDHSQLEDLARLVFEAGGSLPERRDLDEAWTRRAVTVDAIRVGGDQVDFADPDSRNEYVSHYVAARAAEEWDNPERVVDLLTGARQVSIRIGSSRDLSAIALQLLHEWHGRDVLGFVSHLARGGEVTRHQFWSVYRDFCKALPHIDVEATTLAEALSAICEATAGDLAGGCVYEAVEQLAKRSATLAQALVAEFVSRSGTPVISFAPSALVGLHQFDADMAHKTALDWTHGEQADVRRAGMAALGSFAYEGKSDPRLAATKERLSELRSKPAPNTDDVLIRTHSNLLKAAPDLGKGLGMLMERDESSSRYEAARALMAWKDTETLETWWLGGIESLARTPTEEAATLGLLDHALATAAENHPHVAINFLERFISERSAEHLVETDVSELLPLTSRNLHTSRKDALEAAVTRWFSSTDHRLHRLAHTFVQTRSGPENGAESDDLVLDLAELCQLDEATIIHALKRIMGWVVGGRPLAVLLVSALSRPPDDPDSDSIAQFLVEELANFVLYNYPGDAGEFLRKRAEEHHGTRTGRILQRALKESETYYDSLRGLPQLQELRPPDRRMHLIGLSYAKMQSRIMEEARRASAILDLIRRIPLKYGRGFFSRNEEGGFSTTAPLTSFSHEVEIPRGEVINPVGFALHRLMLRRSGLDTSDGSDEQP